MLHTLPVPLSEGDTPTGLDYKKILIQSYYSIEIDKHTGFEGATGCAMKFS